MAPGLQHTPPWSCSAPSESEIIPPQASPLPGHGPAGCPFQTFVRWPAGPHVHICNTTWMSLPCRPESSSSQSRVQAPLLLGLSINIWMPGITYGTTPRPWMTLKAHPVLGVFY